MKLLLCADMLGADVGGWVVVGSGAGVRGRCWRASLVPGAAAGLRGAVLTIYFTIILARFIPIKKIFCVLVLESWKS